MGEIDQEDQSYHIGTGKVHEITKEGGLRLTKSLQLPPLQYSIMIQRLVPLR